MQLPKNYLSYSSIDCFYKTSTHRDWIKRYIYKEKGFESKELLFGRRVADNQRRESMFDYDEDLTEVLSSVHVEGQAEMNLVLQQRGFYVTSYLDKCTTDYKHITEYKTGKGFRSNGEPLGWTQEKVNQHKQLDFYSWIIYENFGILPTCELIWMETIYQGADIIFTGRVERFKRKVTKKEIAAIKEWTHEAAKKMEQVYRLYLDGHDLLTDAKHARELIKTLDIKKSYQRAS